MIRTEDRQINGSRYTIVQMTAWKALQMQARLFKLVGPAFAEPEKLLSKLAEVINEREIEALVWDLIHFSQVRKDGMELTKSLIDIEFAGDIGTLFALVKAIVEVNYGDFLEKSGIGNLIERK